MASRRGRYQKRYATRKAAPAAKSRAGARPGADAASTGWRAPCDNPRVSERPSHRSFAALVALRLRRGRSWRRSPPPRRPPPRRSPRPALPVLDDLRGAAGPRGLAARRSRCAAPGARCRRAKQTTAFAAGTVAVSVDLRGERRLHRPRAARTGRGATPAIPGDRRANVLAKVEAALDLVERAFAGRLSEAFLPAAGQYGAPRTVTTGYEADHAADRRVHLRLPQSDAGWRWQIMGKLGFTHDAERRQPPPERAYADKVRRANGADWAFVLYVVDSLRDADGMFRDGADRLHRRPLRAVHRAHLRQRRLRIRATSRRARPRDGAPVFGALDEYAPPRPGYPSTGDLFSGYLGVKNRNAVRGGTTDLPCIMRGSQDDAGRVRLRVTCARPPWGRRVCATQRRRAARRDRHAPRFTSGAPVARRRRRRVTVDRHRARAAVAARR